MQQVRDLIEARHLSVGAPLPTERELGDLFGAGRNTVRESLQVLKAYGIIEVRPKTGAVISAGHGEAVRKLFSFHKSISPESFNDAQGFRRIIELGVGDQLILMAGDADFDRLVEINARLLESSDSEEAAACDYEFHEAIVSLAGNRTLLAAYRMLRPVIEEIMQIGKSARPVQIDTHRGHGDIINALRARDRIAYAYLISRHLEYGLKFMAKPPAEVDEK